MEKKKLCNQKIKSYPFILSLNVFWSYMWCLVVIYGHFHFMPMFLLLVLVEEVIGSLIFLLFLILFFSYLAMQSWLSSNHVQCMQKVDFFSHGATIIGVSRKVYWFLVWEHSWFPLLLSQCSCLCLSWVREKSDDDDDHSSLSLLNRNPTHIAGLNL